jgi:hydroxyacylglutathione hydrolase
MKIQVDNNGITVFESSLYRTTSIIVELGKSIILIDPNWLPIEVDYIKNYISFHYAKHTKYILFTHSDYDHIIGYGAFADYKVIATVEFSENIERQKILAEISDFDRKYYITRSYPTIYPLPEIIIIADYQTLFIDGLECIFYKAPGHTFDGMFTIIPSKNLWIAGDYLSNIEIPFIDDSSEKYQNTLDKALKIFKKYIDIHILVPGHGDVSMLRSDIHFRIKRDITYLQMVSDYAKNPTHADLVKLENYVLRYANNTDLLEANRKNIQCLV